MGATHRVSVEHHTETGDTVSDGAGGTTDVTEWVTVVQTLARFTESTSATQGRERDVAGPVDIDAPTVRFDPKDVGTLSWVTDPDTGDRDPEYTCDIADDGNWRVTIHGHGGDEQYAIDNVRVHHAAGPVPTRVVAVLEHHA